MKRILFSIVLLSSFILSFANSKPSPDEFAKNVISVGVVVSDLETSLDFYTNIIGMTKVGGFTVPAEKSAYLGLTDHKEIVITTLKLEDSANATEWKLMTFGGKATHPKQMFIDNDTGIQYVTINVVSIAPFLKRFKENNVKILSAEPSVLGNDRFLLLVQDPDGTFIELIGGK